MEGVLYANSLIAGIAVDVRISDNHVIESEITQNTIESGAIVSDHIIHRPRKLSILFQQVNSKDGLARAISVWQQFRDLWRQRQLLSIQTLHETYDNMAIQNVSGLHTVPYLGALQCSLQLVQVNFVTFQYVQVTASQLGQDVAKTASSPIDQGTKPTTEVPVDPASQESTAYQLLKAIKNAMSSQGTPAGATP
jgi:hypothetical protein